MIFGACAQQPILIQTQTDVPARVLPVEGWVVEELRLYNRYLGRGRVQSVFKATASPDDPTMIVGEVQINCFCIVMKSYEIVLLILLQLALVYSS